MARRDAVLNISAKDNATGPLKQIQAALKDTQSGMRNFAAGTKGLTGPMSEATAGYRGLLQTFGAGAEGALARANAAHQRLSDSIGRTGDAISASKSKTRSLQADHAALKKQLDAGTQAVVNLHVQMQNTPKGSPERKRFEGMIAAAHKARAEIQRAMAGVSSGISKSSSETLRLTEQLRGLNQQAAVAANAMRQINLAPNLSGFGVAKGRILEINSQMVALRGEIQRASKEAAELGRQKSASPNPSQALISSYERAREVLKALKREQHALTQERGGLTAALNRSTIPQDRVINDARTLGGRTSGFSAADRRRLKIEVDTSDVDAELDALNARVARKLARQHRLKVDAEMVSRASGYTSPDHASAQRRVRESITDADVEKATADLDRYRARVTAAEATLQKMVSRNQEANDSYTSLSDAIRRQAAATEAAEKAARKAGTVDAEKKLGAERAELEKLIASREKLSGSINSNVKDIAREEARLASLRNLRQAAASAADRLRAGRTDGVMGDLSVSPERAMARYRELTAEIEKTRASVRHLNTQNRAQPGNTQVRDAYREARDELSKFIKEQRRLRAQAPSLRNSNVSAIWRDLGRTIRGLDQVNASAGRAEGGMRRLARAMNIFGTDTRTALSIAQRMRGQLLSMAAAYVGFYGAISQAQGVIQTFRDVEAAGARLNYVFAGNGERSGREMRYLRERADELGLSISQVTTDYTKFAAAAAGAGMNNAGVRDIFEGVTAASRVNKLSTEQVSRLFTALNQSISKNQVYAEELRGQMAEALPGAVTLFAQAMGYGADEMAAFNKAMAAGKFDGQSIVKFGQFLSANFADSLGPATQGFEAKLARFQNAIFEARENIGKAGFMDGLIKAMGELQGFFESDDGQAYFEKIGQGAGALFQAVAVLAKNLDTLVAVGVAALGVKATHVFAQILGGVLATAMGTAAAAGPMRLALDSVTSSSMRTTASISALSGVQRVAQVTSLRLAQGLRILGGALATVRSLVGGWVGVLAIAATAVGAWWTSSSAKKAAEARQSFEGVANAIASTGDAVADSKGNLEDYLKTLEKVGKAKLESDAREASRIADQKFEDVVRPLVDQEAAKRGDQHGWFMSATGLGEKIARREVEAEVYDGEIPLIAELDKLRKGLRDRTIDLKAFQAGVDKLHADGKLDADMAATIQAYGVELDKSATGARILQLRAKLLSTTGKEQQRVMRDLAALTSGSADAAEAAALNYDKYLEAMAAIEGDASEFKEAVDASEALAKTEEAAKNALAALEELREGMDPEAFAKLQKSVNDARERARRQGMADFITEQAAKEDLEISIDGATIAALERISGALEMTAAGIMRSSDLTLDPPSKSLYDFFLAEEGMPTTADGKRAKAYRDKGGVLTIGLGHTSAAGGLQVTEGMEIPIEEARRIFAEDIKTFSKVIDEEVVVPLTEGMRTALISYNYNTGALSGSRIVDALNARDYAGASDLIRNGINTVKGVPDAGLTSRRGREADLFASQGLLPPEDYRGSRILAQQASGTAANPFTAAQMEAMGRIGSMMPDVADAAAARISDAVLARPELLDDPSFRRALANEDVDAIAKSIRDAGEIGIGNAFAQAAGRDARRIEDEAFSAAIKDYDKLLENVKGELSSRDLTDSAVRERAIAEEVARISREATEGGYSLEQLTGKSRGGALQEIRKTVEAAADLERAKQERDAAEKAVEDKRDFDKDTAEQLDDANLDVRVAEMNAQYQEALRLGQNDMAETLGRELALLEANREIDKRERSSGQTVSAKDRQAIVDAAMAQYEIEQKVTREKQSQESLDRAMTALEERRSFLETQLEDAKSDGDAERQRALKDELSGVNAELLSAIENARAFHEALGGPESEAALRRLEELEYTVKRSDESTAKYREGMKAIGDVISGQISNAFGTMTQSIAQGGNAFRALGVAVASSVGGILQELGMMIMKAVIAKAVMSALGMIPGGSAIGTSLASLGNGGTGLEQWFGGVHHDGGTVGERQGRGLGDVISRLIGLKGNERVTILETGEEVLTSEDPRHRRNLIGDAIRKYHSGGLIGMPADALSSSLSSARKASSTLGAAMAAKPAPSKSGDVKIVNTFDAASFLSEGLSSAAGEKTLLNAVAANSAKIKAILK